MASVASTNDYANFLCDTRQVNEGTLIWARKQLNGKGQRGNHWESENGLCLTLSIVYFPDFLSLEKVNFLGVFAALAARDFLHYYFPNPDFKIKWPNDLIVNNKKIGGVLIENNVQGGKLQRSIVGIGININQENFGSKLPDAISVRQITGRKTELSDLINPDLFRIFDQYFLALKEGRFSELLNDYNTHLWGKEINKTFSTPQENIIAQPINLNFDGTLTIRDVKGRSFAVSWPDYKLNLRD